MKFYFYSENDKQLGPFSFLELEQKRIKKTTLVWTEGLTEWTEASNVPELKEILVADPPALPKRNAIENSDSVKIHHTQSNSSASKVEYVKETEATVVGAILLLTPSVLHLTGIWSFDSASRNDEARIILAVIALGLRIFVTFWVVGIAKRLNRNYTGWGWFAFFLPSIALIIIGILKRLPLKIEIDSTLSLDDQVAILEQKANELESNARYAEAKLILQKVKELTGNYSNIDERINNCDMKIEAAQNNRSIEQEVLENDQILSITKSNKYSGMLGSPVSIDGQKPEDCFVKPKEKDIRYEIKDGKLYAEYYILRFKQKDGTILELDGNRVNGIVEGSRAWINNEPAPDGTYNKGLLSNATVRNGVLH